MAPKTPSHLEASALNIRGKVSLHDHRSKTKAVLCCCHNTFYYPQYSQGIKIEPSNSRIVFFIILINCLLTRFFGIMRQTIVLAPMVSWCVFKIAKKLVRKIYEDFCANLPPSINTERAVWPDLAKIISFGNLLKASLCSYLANFELTLAKKLCYLHIFIAVKWPNTEKLPCHLVTQNF